MMDRPGSAMLPDGLRLHLHHGPIDLIVEAFGAKPEVEAAYRQVAGFFDGVLHRLVDELELLRTPMSQIREEFHGPVARRMAAAVRPHRKVFVTPMAAVAGAVADAALAAAIEDRTLKRAYVNNGGDIALHLAAGERFTVGMVSDFDAPALDGRAEVSFETPVRGIATSGWQGRSMSLGIADSVTVLARTAADADVAATLIANTVDVDHPAVRRVPAVSVELDSDLGERPVTVDVGTLDPASIDTALQRGADAARTMQVTGRIVAAALTLKGETRIVGSLAVEGRRDVAAYRNIGPVQKGTPCEIT